MNNIPSGSTPPPVIAKPEAAPAQPSTKSSPEAQQPAAGQAAPAAPSQAVTVTLATAISTELEKLGQALALRIAVLKQLPPELSELIQNMMKTEPPTQTALREGLATLLRSPQNTAEKLLQLAAALEEAANDPAENQTQSSGKTPASPDADTGSDVLKMAAKLLREAANLPQAVTPAPSPAGQESPDKAPLPGQPESQTTGKAPGTEQKNTPEKPLATNQQPLPEQNKAPAQNPGSVPQTPAALRHAPLPEQQPPAQPNTAAGQQALTGQPPAPEQTADGKPNTATGQQALPGQASVSGSLTGQSPAPQAAASSQPQPPAAALPVRELAPLLTTIASQPELLKKLTPEMIRLLQNLLTYEKTTLPGSQLQPQTQTAGNRPPQSEELLQLASALDQAAETAAGEKPAASARPALAAQTAAELAETLRGKNAGELKTAADMVRELAKTMPRAGGMLAERAETHSVLSFTTPLYFGDGQTAYPAHIHIFNQQRENPEKPGSLLTETWLRISLETENLGPVETHFHLYDEAMVDVKVHFANASSAAEFAASTNEIKAKLGDLPLTLGEFLVK